MARRVAAAREPQPSLARMFGGRLAFAGLRERRRGPLESYLGVLLPELASPRRNSSRSTQSVPSATRVFPTPATRAA